jgi:hypothetical protein
MAWNFSEMAWNFSEMAWKLLVELSPNLRGPIVDQGLGDIKCLNQCGGVVDRN